MREREIRLDAARTSATAPNSISRLVLNPPESWPQMDSPLPDIRHLLRAGRYRDDRQLAFVALWRAMFICACTRGAPSFNSERRMTVGIHARVLTSRAYRELKPRPGMIQPRSAQLASIPSERPRPQRMAQDNRVVASGLTFLSPESAAKLWRYAQHRKQVGGHDHGVDEFWGGVRAISG